MRKQTTFWQQALHGPAPCWSLHLFCFSSPGLGLLWLHLLAETQKIHKVKCMQCVALSEKPAKEQGDEWVMHVMWGQDNSNASVLSLAVRE